MRATLFIGVVAVVAGAIWALQPRTSLDSGKEVLTPGQPDSPMPKQRSIAINSDAFGRARIWNPPQIVQVAPSQIVQAQPPRLQLIGIIQRSGQMQAALYDPDDNRLLIVSSGQTIKGHQVTKITPQMVELSTGDAKHELRLKEAAS